MTSVILISTSRFNVISNKFLTLTLALFSSGSFAAPPISVYDGFWVGRVYCGENIGPNPNPKYIGAFSNKITFNVLNGEAVASVESSEHINNFKLKIDKNNNVTIDQRGNYKNNVNNAWLVATIGNVRAGLISTQGTMTPPDKSRIIRNGCGFELSNNEVVNRIAAFQEEELKKQKKPAVIAQAPKSPKSESSAVVNAEKPRVTPPPKPAAAKDSSPARVAAIGNVEEPKSPKSNSKVTSNPIDKMSKKSSNDVWINFNPSITVQERQFCRLIENFRVELNSSRATQNQIKINETNRNLVQALNSLMPDGKFQGWVMRSMTVGQASDGSADILFQLPCDVIVGSNSCDPNPKNFYGTIPEGSRLYTELSKMTVGDFTLVSGEFVYADPKAFDRNRSVATFGYMKTGEHCKAKSLDIGSDFFGIKMTTLSIIK